MARAGVSDLPKTMCRGLISCLTVQEAGRLDYAMTNREARPHLVKSYKGMQSPAFNGYVYVYRGKGCKELHGRGEGHRLERLHARLR